MRVIFDAVGQLLTGRPMLIVCVWLCFKVRYFIISRATEDFGPLHRFALHNL